MAERPHVGWSGHRLTFTCFPVRHHLFEARLPLHPHTKTRPEKTPSTSQSLPPANHQERLCVISAPIRLWCLTATPPGESRAGPAHAGLRRRSYVGSTQERGLRGKSGMWERLTRSCGRSRVYSWAALNVKSRVGVGHRKHLHLLCSNSSSLPGHLQKCRDIYFVSHKVCDTLLLKEQETNTLFSKVNKFTNLHTNGALKKNMQTSASHHTN